MLRKPTATRAVDHLGGSVRTSLHAPRTRKRSIAAATLGALALVGSLLVATPAQAINDTGTGGVFVPASGRVLDTKAGTGGFSTPMEAGKYRTIKIAGVAGIPDDGTVGAVSLNATVSGSPDNGILSGRPDADTTSTTMLIYNANAGEYVSNTAIIAVSAAGTIQVSTQTAARLILDVQGYYTANTDGTAAGGFVPVAGKRIVDTRSGLGAPKALLAPGKSVDIQVTGANGVPAGASGAVVNLLPINSTASDGYLTPYATGSTRPDNALHYAPSVNTSIQAQVRLSSSGKMTIYNGSSTINLVIDLQGYFTKAGVDGATFTPGAGRVYDSRATGNTILASNETRAIQVAGKAGVPVMGSGITAVVLTLTAAHGGSDGRASVWPNGTTQPDTTSINFQTDEIRTNTVTVALGANGKINLANVAAATNYVIDVQGWYVSPQSPTISCPEPYTAGSWTHTVPSTDVTCTVGLPPASASNTGYAISIDGDQVELGDLADTSASIGVTIPAFGGTHTIGAEVDVAGTNNTRAASYQFTLGDWANDSWLPSPPSSATVGLTPTLRAVPVSTDFPIDAVFSYSIFDVTGTAVALSGNVNGAWAVPADLLTVGQTYSWKLTVTGSNEVGTQTEVKTSPTYTFKTAENIPDTAKAVWDSISSSSDPEAAYDSLSDSDRAAFDSYMLPASSEETMTLTPADASAEAAVSSGEVQTQYSSMQEAKAATSASSSACWIGNVKYTKKAAFGNAIWDTYTEGSWCAKGSTITSAKYSRSWSTIAAIGWRDGGKIGSGSGITSNKARIWSQRKMILGSGGWDVQRITPCVRLNGDSRGRTSFSEKCSIVA